MRWMGCWGLPFSKQKLHQLCKWITAALPDGTGYAQQNSKGLRAAHLQGAPVSKQTLLSTLTDGALGIWPICSGKTMAILSPTLPCLSSQVRYRANFSTNWSFSPWAPPLALFFISTDSDNQARSRRNSQGGLISCYALWWSLFLWWQKGPSTSSFIIEKWIDIPRDKGKGEEEWPSLLLHPSRGLSLWDAVKNN